MLYNVKMNYPLDILIKSFKHQKIFKNVSDDELKFIAQLCVKKTYKQGDLLIEQGEESNGIFIIAKGVVFVYQISDDGNIIPLDLLPLGSICGEMGAFTGEIRCANVEALTDGKYFCLSQKNINEIIDKIPHIHSNIVFILSERIRSHNEYQEYVKINNSYERVRQMLIFLAQYFPERKISLTHEKLAQIIGITRPRLSEIIEELGKKGIIKNSYKSIQIS